MSEITSNAAGGEYATARGRLDASEALYIAQRAAEGISAANIAKMTGRPLADVAPFCIRLKPREVARPVMGSRSRGKKPEPVPAPIKRTIASASALYGLTVEDMTGPRVDYYAIRARDHVAWRLHKMGHAYSRIGRWLGGRDHSTIRTAVQRHDARIRAEAGDHG